MKHGLGSLTLVTAAVVLVAVGALPAQTQQRSQPVTLDRSKRPTPGPAREFRLPRAERGTLSNGLAVYLIESHELPIVSVRAISKVGPLLDPVGAEGLSVLMSGMLGEGTTTMTADQLAEAFADLGSPVTPSGFTTIAPNLERSLELLADMLVEPSFPQEALDRQKQNTITGLQRAKESPQTIAIRIFNAVVYGAGHPYARTATEQTVANITREDLRRFHAEYVRPQNLTLLIAGDVTASEVAPMVERAFAKLERGGTTATYELPPPVAHGPTRIYLYDRPGSPQSVVRIGHMGPSRDSEQHFGLETLNAVFGGLSGSRLNQNLRQARSFTYGAFSRFQWRRGRELSTFISQADIAAPKTDSALVEWMRELRGIQGERPITAAELNFAITNRVASLPARLEAVTDVATMLGDLLANDVPLDYFERYIRTVAALTEADVTELARRYIAPERSAIVIVGDRTLIETGVRAANIAPVVIVDENGSGIP